MLTCRQIAEKVIIVIKFHSPLDLKLMLLDIGRSDLLESSTPDTVTEELCELFLKHRKGRKKLIKDFRRSQISKKSWRTHRFSYMKGIKKWHRSIEGKKFHRALSRFMTNRIKNESINELDRLETVKAVSSLKTHLYIESGYYRSLDEDINYELFLEYVTPLLSNLEHELLVTSNPEVPIDTLEVLARLVDSRQLLLSLGLTESTLLDIEVDDSYGVMKSLLKHIKNEPILSQITAQSTEGVVYE